MVVAETNEIVLGGLTAIVDAADGLDIVGTAHDADSCAGVVSRTAPHIAVIGSDIARQAEVPWMGADGVDTSVVVYGQLRSEDEFAGIISNGAVGYLPSGASSDAVINALHLVAQGSIVLGRFGALVVRAGMAHIRGGATGRLSRSAHVTAREQEVLNLIAQGLENAEIATELNVGVQTVKTHVTALLRKLACRKRVELALTVANTGDVIRGVAPTHEGVGPPL